MGFNSFPCDCYDHGFDSIGRMNASGLKHERETTWTMLWFRLLTLLLILLS